ncbi:MAG: PucR family transcriptional regulator [Bacillota bacterium]
MITLKEILSFEEYEDLKVIAGESGLDRKISSVTILDSPDGYKWTKGGEFVITSGYVLSNEPAKIKELIVALDKLGASAFGIKLKRYINEISTEIINKANDLNFPIIVIPEDYPFKKIINPVMSSIIDKQNEKLVFSKNIHKTFTQLVLEGCDEKKIIIKLEELINNDIIFYNKLFDEFQYGYLASNNDIKENNIDELKEKFKSYPLKIDKKIYGYIFVTDKKSIDDYDEIALEQAATVLKLQIQKRISNKEIENRYREEFVMDLIFANINSKEEVIKRGKLYNWNFDEKIAAFIVDIDDFKENYTKLDIEKSENTLKDLKEKIFTIAKKMMNKYYNDVIFANLSDKIIFLNKNNDIKNEYNLNIEEVGDEIRQKVNEKVDFTVTVGIGEYKDDVFAIKESYEEAKEAINVSRAISKENNTSSYEKLGAYRLLDSFYSNEKAEKFLNSYLGDLITYEEKNNINLIESLKVLIRNDWNMKEAAKKLYIHYNTMKYRMNKVENILEVDLSKSEDRFNLNLSLKLLEIKEK